MGSEESTQLDIAELFHGLLFAYEKAARNVLGSGCEVFVQPTLEILQKIYDKKGLKLFQGKSLDEAVASFSKMLLEAKLVKRIGFDRIGQDKHLLKIDGCAWAKHIHRELKPKDATCPLALIVMAIYRKYLGEKVEEAESKYLAEGTETIIKPFYAAAVTFETESLKATSGKLRST
jgi:hypothetical protein